MAIRWPWVSRKVLEAAEETHRRDLDAQALAHQVAVNRLKTEHKQEMEQTTKAVHEVLPKLLRLSVDRAMVYGHPNYSVRVDVQGEMVYQFRGTGHEDRLAEWIAWDVERILRRDWHRLMYVHQSGRTEHPERRNFPTGI